MLIPLTSVKQSHRQPKKYPEQVNIITPLDICFLINKFDIFINKNTNIKPAKYIIFKHKKIVEVVEKRVFKVITIVNISTNIQIFNSRFVDKIKNGNINKAYKKSWLVIQAYNNKKKYLI